MSKFEFFKHLPFVKTSRKNCANTLNWKNKHHSLETKFNMNVCWDFKIVSNFLQDFVFLGFLESENAFRANKFNELEKTRKRVFSKIVVFIPLTTSFQASNSYFFFSFLFRLVRKKQKRLHTKSITWTKKMKEKLRLKNIRCSF